MFLKNSRFKMWKCWQKWNHFSVSIFSKIPLGRLQKRGKFSVRLKMLGLFSLNMIPWYSKRILLHYCKGAEKMLKILRKKIIIFVFLVKICFLSNIIIIWGRMYPFKNVHNRLVCVCVCVSIGDLVTTNLPPYLQDTYEKHYHRALWETFDPWNKFRKISDFQKNFRFLDKFQIFGKITDFRKKFRISEKISDFRKNFRFSEKFGQNFEIWLNFEISLK